MRKIKPVSHYGKSWTCGSAATVTAGEELVACLIRIYDKARNQENYFVRVYRQNGLRGVTLKLI